jgi:hypothetical protein
LSAGGIVFIFFLSLLGAAFLVSFILWRCRVRRRARVAAQAKAEKERQMGEVEAAEAKVKQAEKDAREKERQAKQEAEKAAAAAAARAAAHAAAVTAAVDLSRFVGRLRSDISARLARDAVQGAVASPLHANLLAQLNQQGNAGSIIGRYTQLVETGVARALIKCELDSKCRLLSLMALNPELLPPPSMHVFCRTAVLAAATDALEPFVRVDMASGSNGFGTEGSSSPSSTAVASSAREAASSAVQRECAQFASAWLSSTVTSLRVPLKRPPPVADLQRDAGGAWLFAMAVPAQAIVVDMPADDSYASAGEGAGNSGGMFLHPSASPSAPLPPPPSYSAAVFNGGGSSSSAFSPSDLFQAQLPNQCSPSFATELEGSAAAAAPSCSHIVFVSPTGAAAEGEGIELQSPPPGGARPFNDV